MSRTIQGTLKFPNGSPIPSASLVFEATANSATVPKRVAASLTITEGAYSGAIEIGTYDIRLRITSTIVLARAVVVAAGDAIDVMALIGAGDPLTSLIQQACEAAASEAQASATAAATSETNAAASETAASASATSAASSAAAAATSKTNAAASETAAAASESNAAASAAQAAQDAAAIATYVTIPFTQMATALIQTQTVVVQHHAFQ